jgi:hypothetical protein
MGRAQRHRLRKNSDSRRVGRARALLGEGHEFTRAVKGQKKEGL